MIKKFSLFFIPVFLFLAILISLAPGRAKAQQDDSKGAAAEVKKDFNDAIAATKDYAFDKKEEYEKFMQEKIDSLGQRIQELKTKAKNVSADKKKDLDAALDDLEMKKEAAAKKLAGIKGSGSAAWAEVKKDLDQAFTELGEAYDKAASFFTE